MQLTNPTHPWASGNMIPITCRAAKRNTVRYVGRERPRRRYSRRIATRIETHTTNADRRRSLAWHIVRRPRGLVAGAIQYGHLQTRITLGYSGSYASGFPDELTYEEWLYRLEQLADWEERLAGGEHVSGPAADAYRYRVQTASAQFAGRVLTSGRQARDLLDNPLLQVFPGKAMTCVLNPQQALCQLLRTEGNTRVTPDKSDCRPVCKNLAYTTANIAELQDRARHLREIVADPLAPSLRKARERHELDRIQGIIIRHYREGKHA